VVVVERVVDVEVELVDVVVVVSRAVGWLDGGLFAASPTPDTEKAPKPRRTPTTRTRTNRTELVTSGQVRNGLSLRQTPARSEPQVPCFTYETNGLRLGRR
jgi:hypothetical protein